MRDRRGSIEVTDSHVGRMRCRECGATWTAIIRPDSGRFYRGAWTCYRCGANTHGPAPGTRMDESVSP